MQLLPMTASSHDLRLRTRLEFALPADAEPVSRRICAQISEAATRSAAWPTRRRARLLSLLCIDALNPNRPEPARRLRWRRLIATLAPFARETRSMPLRQLVFENADLITRGQRGECGSGGMHGGMASPTPKLLNRYVNDPIPEAPDEQRSASLCERTWSRMRNSSLPTSM
jgi:hypothetical protein